MSYNEKYRKKAIEYHEKGHSIRLTAETFGISANTLGVWLKKYRESGDLGRKYRAYKPAINEEELLKYLKENPDAYQKEIGEHFGRDQSVVCRTLKRLKITRKKDKALQRTKL
jgi:transposase